MGYEQAPCLARASLPLYASPMRALAALCMLGSISSLSVAPLQCVREPDPELAPNDSPDEALYDLAQRFRAAGNEPARRATLEYLRERYPNSRFAEAALMELEATRKAEARPAPVQPTPENGVDAGAEPR